MNKLVAALCVVSALTSFAGEEEPEVIGALSVDQVKRVVTAQHSALRACVDAELARDAGTPPAGRVAIRFMISPKGSVSTASVSGTTVSLTLGECTRALVRQLKFPSPTSGGVVIVTYPFVFSGERGSEELVVTGGLTAETVKQVLQRRSVDVMECAEDHRRGDGGMPGTGVLVIKFTVDATGKVTSSHVVSSSSGSAGFDECVRALATTVQFPPPERGVLTVVTFPFQLTNWTGETRGITGIGTTSVKLKSDEAWVRGGLELDAVKRVVLAHTAQVRACAPTDVRGTVTLNFVVDSNGKVDETTVLRSTVADKAISTCVAKAVRAMKFPPPEGGGVAIAVYPFTFDATSAPR
ncbi:MAG: TonB family protein [Archangium sp.]